jgi:serine/threonine-protein kinase
VRGTAEYAPQHVVFSDETGRLFALPFDLARLQPVAAPLPLPEQTYVPPVGQAQFSVALSGALVYVNAADGVPQLARSLVWVDREGKEEPLGLPPRAYAVPRLSPDGTLVALDIRDQQNDIWIWSLMRQSFARFTTGPFLDMAPVWSSDGRRIIWTSTRNSANPALFWQAADGTGSPERLATSARAQFPSAALPDGRGLLFSEGSPDGRGALLHRLALQGEHAVDVVLSGQARFNNAEVSPDGRWIAYESDESGQFEIYVRVYPETGNGRWQISSQGGTRPVWSRNGRELFFLDGADRLNAATIETTAGGGFAAGSSRRLLDAAYFPGFSSRGTLLRGYDVSPDGRRFLMIKGPSGSNVLPVVTVALNWRPARGE